MLSLIGLGLGDEKDITLKGLEVARSSDVVYLEAYTSLLIAPGAADKLSVLIGKEIVVADREIVESGAVLRPAEAEGKHVALLVVGDPFGATTHSDLVVRCHQAGIATNVVHNASVINAVAQCGLQLYLFGQVLSLCFWTQTWRPDSWYPRFVRNRKSGLHTLLLLDIKVKEPSDEDLARGRMVNAPPRFMTIRGAVEQILEVQEQRRQRKIDAADTGDDHDDEKYEIDMDVNESTTIGVGVARLGSATQQIVAAPLKFLRDYDFGPPLHSLIVPAAHLHECEVEHLEQYCMVPEHVELLRSKCKR